MKNGFAVFFAVVVALGASWLGFVVGPTLQLGKAKQATILNSSDTWPLQRTGEATLGLQIYRANGCASCHTEQIRQEGVTCDVVVTSIGKNRAAFMKAVEDIGGLIYKNNPNDKNLEDIETKNTWKSGDAVPLPVFRNITKEIADAVSDKITTAGGKSETHIIATGPDIAHGWGVRGSVAADYLYDYPVQLGSLRVGPDLADVGARLGNASWQLVHLYSPRAVVKNSAMPSFKFLFEVKKIGDAPSPDALNLPTEFAPPAGFEAVPKPEAKELAAYLLSLRADEPLYEAPFTPTAVEKK